tara:strand:+ start:145 stop:534 length:390 start_codon:yes stop_codon:yes gene_type:complete
MTENPKLSPDERKVSPATAKAMNDILSGDQKIQYKNESDGRGNVEFTPGLPNNQIMEAIMNNKNILMAHRDVMQKVLNMEWQWFERRIIKWLGDTPESRSLKDSLRQHIKNEKKWIKRGAKADEVGLFV